MKTKVKAKIMDELGLERTLNRLTHEILEKNRGVDNIVILGMRTRGAYIADRIHKKIIELEKKDVPIGYLDVTFYRDDFRIRLKQPEIQVTKIPCDIDNRDIILIDDVLYTGRTVRAAMDAIMDFGRPSSIQLVILIDRGHRELPIKANIVGKYVITSIGEEIRVKMREIDDEDAVYLVEISD
ncbi:bifunctional pyr operon transcriptional regulator/uracil phosphoribosyltransferase PyrR [candidate division KSB1 bacterium]|nr:MAG: bifunctional pyr operon transcriptional regulator/uracil phosphoribosyltransferase PyrR [candidate division KSB1 bacterium]